MAGVEGSAPIGDEGVVTTVSPGISSIAPLVLFGFLSSGVVIIRSFRRARNRPNNGASWQSFPEKRRILAPAHRCSIIISFVEAADYFQIERA
jgi:hypothetical protein